MAGQSTLWVGTARMLRRAGFGVTGPEVDAAVARGWPGHLDAMLAADPDADPGALATPMPALPAPQPPGKRATPRPASSTTSSSPNSRACCRIGGSAAWSSCANRSTRS